MSVSSAHSIHHSFHMLFKTNWHPMDVYLPEWRDSVIIPIYKEKGDIQDCGNYLGIKLMSHTMKIWEKIIDRRLREETTIGDEQFGFMPGGRRMQYLLCGNLWRNIGKNRKNCTWYL